MRTRTANLSLSSVFSAQLFNELRVQWARDAEPGLANTNDAWYRANGTTRVRPITPGAPNYVGSEIDLTATYQPIKFLTFQAGYSHFFAGSYVRATGPDGDADFGYVQALVNF